MAWKCKNCSKNLKSIAEAKKKYCSVCTIFSKTEKLLQNTQLEQALFALGITKKIGAPYVVVTSSKLLGNMDEYELCVAATQIFSTIKALIGEKEAVEMFKKIPHIDSITS